MSSTPKRGSRQATPAPEKKAPGGPVITPQALGIALGIILVIAIIAYYQMVVVKHRDEKARIESSSNQTQLQIDTYKKKGAKLAEARDINLAIREKLATLDYLFLEDQTSLVPFFENSLFPLIETSRMRSCVVTAEEFEFKLNMAMQPIKTLPASTRFEEPHQIFTIDYDGEKNGVPTESPLDTRPNSFLEPYTITLEQMRGTYEDVKHFVRRLQTTREAELLTVHCVKNDDSKNFGVYRTETEWTVIITVYFMNPEKTASGDQPPDPPGAETC